MNFLKLKREKKLDLYPEELKTKIDEVNSWVLKNINLGVYRCGFAETQENYELAFDQLFEHLDKAEDVLSKNRYLVGDQFTVADIKLFNTLIRFDIAHYGLYKTNKKRIIEYPNLQNYVKEIYQMKKINECINFTHIKLCYFSSKKYNPSLIIPKGPELDFDSPHNRSTIGSKKE